MIFNANNFEIKVTAFGVKSEKKITLKTLAQV